jgi:ketopantoate hydroxymethyltransferase
MNQLPVIAHAGLMPSYPTWTGRSKAGVKTRETALEAALYELPAQA